MTTATEALGNQRFLKLSQLGIGGMGVVYEALDCERNLTIALKTLRTLDAKQLLRFKQEFRALRDIKHKNLVELGELFEEDDNWFFTMELVEGKDIISYMRPSGDSFDEQRMRRALHGLSAGLAALHRAGKVHCDVKPSNVLVTDEGRAVLLDFGVVTELSPGSGSGINPRAGSPLYMAPEQSAGKPVGPPADWYAVGALLFKGLTGKVPFRGRDPGHVVQRKQREEPPHPGQLVADLPGDLAELCARLIARNVLHRPTQAEILSVLGVREEHVQQVGGGQNSEHGLFVGRQQALAELEAAYADARRGSAVSVFVEGESGVGKSTLIERFVGALEREHGVHVFRAQCHEREFVRYNALDGIVDGIARFLRDTRRVPELAGAVEHVGPLLHLFPVLRNVRQLREHAREVAGDVRRQAFAGVRQLLTALAAHFPFCFVIDDIHWADADSLALLAELVGARGGPPLLLLATARKQDDGRSCAARQTVRGAVRTIELGGLTPVEAEELARRLWQRCFYRRAGTGMAAPPARASGARDEDIAGLVAETDGHPLFMDELVRYLVRHGDGESGSRRAHLDDALRERITELEPDTQRVLQLVVVAGMPISHAIVAETSAMSAESFAHGLSALRRGNLVRMTGRDRHALMTVYHARVRESLYQHLSPELRQSLHFQLARVMEASGSDPVQLATHFHRGGELEKATHYAIQAARAAAMSLAFDQATALYQMALSTMPAADGSAKRSAKRSDRIYVELFAELGQALENAGQVKLAADAYIRAAAHVERANRAQPDNGATEPAADAHAEWLDLHRRAAQQLLSGGYMEQGITAVRDVLERSGMKLPKTGKRALPRVAWNFFRLGRHQFEWRAPSPEELARPDSREQLRRIDACWTAGAGLSLVDTLRGVFFATQGARMALRLGEPYRLVRSLCTASVAASALGRGDSAARMVEAAQRAAREHGSAQAFFYAETARFIHEFFYQQNWSQCVSSGKQLESLWREAGHGRGSEIDFVIQFYSWALAMHGDIEALTQFYETFVNEAERVGNRLLAVALRVYHSLVHLAANEPIRAADEVTQAIDSWQPGSDDFHLLHAWALFSRGDIRLYCGQPEKEYELDAEFRRLRKSPLRRTLWVAWREQYLVGRFALALAHEAGSMGQRSRQSRELARASAMAKRLAQTQAPVPLAWAALLCAGAARIQGDDDRALFHIERAAAGLEATHSTLHAAAACHRHGQVLGGDEGAALIQSARQTLRKSGVARPERMVDLLAPGWSG